MSGRVFHQKLLVGYFSLVRFFVFKFYFPILFDTFSVSMKIRNNKATFVLKKNTDAHCKGMK